MSSNRSAELLKTKLTPPRLPDSLVHRDELLGRLSAGVSCRLTLISAPAGSGKTTLVSQWLNALADAPPSGWVALDSGDNDPVRFWRYGIAACQKFVAPAVGEAAMARLNRPQSQNFDAVVTTLVNELADLTHQAVLVLEDYHCITAPVIHDALTFLLDHLPPTVHVVIITRGDCPLPLARWRALGELNELTADDLRFSEQEVATFFHNALAVTPESDKLAQFALQIEGWAAGLRLAALALQAQRSPEAVSALLGSFSGTHQYITEYLTEEVLATQPEPVQDFLLQTSFLPRLSSELCDAVTAQTNSADTLANLNRANMFITQVDGEGRWYRYHTLFAEAMRAEARRRFGEGAWSELHQRAADWHSQQGLHAEAVEIALAVNDFDRAAALMLADNASESYRIYREFHTLRRWLDHLPDAILAEYPALCFNYAMAIMFTDDRHDVATSARITKALDMAAASWQAQEAATDELGRVYAMRSMTAWWLGDFEQAYIAARHAQELLADDDHEWQGVNLLQIAHEELLNGQLNAAEATLRNARHINERVENPHGALAVRHLQAQVCMRRGNLWQAHTIYQQILDDVGADPELSDDRGHALAGLAALYYEWNDLDRAAALAAEAQTIAHSLNASEILTPAVQVMARVLHARGDVSQAQQLLNDTLTTIMSPLHWQELHLTRMELALADGNLDAVQRWQAQHSNSDHTFRPHLLHEREALLNTRLLMAQNELDDVPGLLSHWQADAHSAGRVRSEIKILILQALTYASRDSVVQARRLLERAIVLAQEEGYQRLFLDEGAPLAALLRDTLPHIGEQAHTVYARVLLVAFAEQDANRLPGAPAAEPILIKPLSDQERRVLRLLAAGLSNPEIAEQLVVSVNTIKTQVRSIYEKLNVTNREQAAEVAQRLRL